MSLLASCLELSITAPDDSLRSCLHRSESHGFGLAFVTNYDATAHVRIWRRTLILTQFEQKTFKYITLKLWVCIFAMENVQTIFVHINDNLS